MPGRGKTNQSDSTSPAAAELALLTELDRIEDVIDELDELGIFSREEAEARRLELHRRLDALEDNA